MLILIFSSDVHVCCSQTSIHLFNYGINFIADLISSPLTTTSGPDPTPNDKLLSSLEKQLSIEMKVKNGAENMIQSISGGHHGRDKKLLAEAQQMLADSKAKIEFLKLRILKVRQNRQLNKVCSTI